jgi:uncharacterized membrane protein YqjE
MSTDKTTSSWRTSLARSAVFRAVGLSTIGFLSWLWFSAEDGSFWKAVALVALLALAALVGVAWYLPRARTETQWRTALDQYADRQEAERPSQETRGTILPPNVEIHP